MEEKVITIATYSTVTDAYIFKNLLNLQGVECFVVDSLITLNPSVVDIHDGGVKLSVREEDAARAISILNRKEEVTDPGGI